MLIRYGADINFVDKNLMSPLHWAARTRIFIAIVVIDAAIVSAQLIEFVFR